MLYGEQDLPVRWTEYGYANYMGLRWQPINKTERAYYSDGNIKNNFESYWDTQTERWQFIRKTEYSYDNNNQAEERLDYLWRKSIADWDPQDRSTAKYDSQGNQVELITFYKRDEEDGWIPDTRYTKQYDYRFSASELIMPSTAETNKLERTIRHSWDIDREEWGFHSQWEYHYSDQVDHLPNLPTDEFLLFPNPVQDFFCFQGPATASAGTFELYDMQGRLLLSRVADERTMIDLGGYSSGVYNYRFIVGQDRYTGQLVKQ